MTRLTASAVLVAGLSLLQAPLQKFQPQPAVASDLVVRLEQAGTIPTHANPTSPIVAGSRLLLIDQAGSIYLWDGTAAAEILGPRNTPAGLRLIGQERILNAAADSAGSTVYVVFVSTSVPAGVPRRQSPREPDAWYVLYAFAFDGARLTTPRPITAMQIRTEGHTGGGLVVLPDGSLLFAVGDNGDSHEDGRDHPQNAAVHLSKILRIDPATGASTVVAVGVRGVQRLVVTGSGVEARLSFVDPGGWVSEEVNSVGLSELFAGAPVNFGWGRAADGRAREGTFLIDRLGNSTETIAATEPGFRAPIAEVGRERATAVAVSGPVASSISFQRITMLFADLVGGSVYAVRQPLTEAKQPVHRVKLVGATGAEIRLSTLTGGGRPDPRFFNFPDGTAGVLLERTGVFYKMTEQK